MSECAAYLEPKNITEGSSMRQTTLVLPEVRAPVFILRRTVVGALTPGMKFTDSDDVS